MSPKFTLNYGVRLEHEQGLQEKNDQFTVAFDRTLNPGGALGNVVNPVTGQRIVGGLVYAGQNGANDVSGRSAGDEVLAARRPGLLDESEDASCAAAYGIYWAPWNYQAPSNANYGQVGSARRRSSSRASSSRPRP